MSKRADTLFAWAFYLTLFAMTALAVLPFIPRPCHYCETDAPANRVTGIYRHPPDCANVRPCETCGNSLTWRSPEGVLWRIDPCSEVAERID